MLIVSWDNGKTQVTSNALKKKSFLAAVNFLEAVFVGFRYEIIFSNISREMALIIETAHLLYFGMECEHFIKQQLTWNTKQNRIII